MSALDYSQLCQAEAQAFMVSQGLPSHALPALERLNAALSASGFVRDGEVRDVVKVYEGLAAVEATVSQNWRHPDSAVPFEAIARMVLNWSPQLIGRIQFDLALATDLAQWDGPERDVLDGQTLSVLLASHAARDELRAMPEGPEQLRAWKGWYQGVLETGRATSVEAAVGELLRQLEELVSR